MKSVVPTGELKKGMFVAELDRPWLGTPFPLQGFLIDDEDQIARLQEYCRTVVVDRRRSIGDHFAARRREKDARLRPPAVPKTFRQLEDADPDDFPAICRLLRQESGARRYRDAPPLQVADGQSRLEAELLYSAPIVEDVKRTLMAVREAIDAGRDTNLGHVGHLVGEMARGVERNPDALIWLSRLKSIDQYSYDHAVDVSVHLMVFGRFLGLPARTVEDLGLAGLMQDVGKVDIPAEILNKPGELSDEEYALMQSHVASSLEILVGQPGFPVEVLGVVAGHHERHDGSGYPRRLKGEKLGLTAELAGLVDTYCAMTRARSYNPAVSNQRALEALIGLRGSRFRAPLVDQFIQCVGLYAIGTLVELNSGEVAVVIQQNQVRRLKPRVLVVLGPDKSVERHPRTLDLMMEPQTGTGEPYRIVHALPVDAYGIDPAEFYLA